MISRLASSAGVDIVIDDAISAKVTVCLSDVPFERALDTIARAAAAQATVEGDLYIVMSARGYYAAPAAAPEQTTMQVFDVSAWEFQSIIPLIEAMGRDIEVEPFRELKAVVVRGPSSQVNAVRATLDGYLRNPSQSRAQNQAFRLVRLSYADAAETAMSLQGQFPLARLTTVRTSNAIAVSAPAEDADLIVDAVRDLDRVPALLSFDVEIVEVSSDDIGSVGIDWQGGQGQPVFTLSFKETDLPSGATPPDLGDVFKARPWLRTSLQIVTHVRMLESSGKAKVLARPSITTLENRTARIVTGDRYTIVITQDSGGSVWQQLQYIDSGVQLEITPRLDSDGGIVVSLNPRISAVTGFSREGYPVMSTREVQTTVRLRDGETLVIGGLIRDESSGTRSKLPILSAIPLIGPLFGSENRQGKLTEIVILLTPRIVSQN
ncbi:MAG: hypothetical protein VB144_15305 [Clostridia bacterium]|nr:hypothetical protein [Clostridia bacterium]